MLFEGIIVVVVYDLADRRDLDGLLDELVRLLVDDELPPSGFVFRRPGTPS